MPQTYPDVQWFNLLRRFNDARRSECSRSSSFPLPVVLSPLAPGGQNSAGLQIAIGARRPEFGRATNRHWCPAARTRPGQAATLYGARLPVQ